MSSFLKRKKVVFNIHLLLAVICSIPLLLIAVTGSIISYQKEIIDFINSSEARIEKSTKAPLEISEILAKFKEQKGVLPVRMQIFNDENKAMKIYATRRDAYFVNPYSGEIISEEKGEKFIRTVLALHRNLGFSLIETDNKDIAKIGKNIVAIATIALFLLIVSGIWVYAPLLKKKFKKAVSVNFKLRGYSFLYNIHSAVGVWFSAVLAVICLTGLYWSYGWYADMINSAFGVKTQNRAQGQNRAMTRQDQGYEFKDVDKVYEVFKAQSVKYDKLTIVLADNNRIFNLAYELNDDRTARAKTMQINAKDANITFDSVKNEPTTHVKIRVNMYQLHTGYFFGEIGKFIWCVASFSILLFFVSGFLMTFKRAFKRK